MTRSMHCKLIVIDSVPDKTGCVAEQDLAPRVGGVDRYGWPRTSARNNRVAVYLIIGDT